MLICYFFISSCAIYAQSEQEWNDQYAKGESHFENGNIDSAQYYFESSYKLAKMVFTEEDWQPGMNAYYLGKIYKSIKKYELAEEMMQLDLKVTINTVGINHSDYGTSLSNLAQLYMTMGQYTKALSLYLEVLEHTEKNLGKEHSLYRIRLSKLANLYEILGENNKALALYREVLEKTQESLGKEHSEYGICLNNLANLYVTMGDHSRALPMHLEALENARKSLGEEHPSYGARLNNLAVLYQTIGEYGKALPLFIEALENTGKNLGIEHVEYGVRLNNLGLVYETLGEYNKALPLFIEALENTGKNLGKEHSDYGISLNNLAGLYVKMGEYSKAMPLYIEALKITEKSLGKEHSEYGIGLGNLAHLYRTKGEYSKALRLYLAALENAEKSLGKGHVNYGISLNNLALLYQKMGEYSKALPLYLETLDNVEKSLGTEHSDYGIYLNNLADLYHTMDEYSKALPLYLEALKNTERSLGKNHPYYGIRLTSLAQLYESMGDSMVALPLFIEANVNLLNQIKEIFSFRSEREKKAFLSKVEYLFGIYQSANYRSMNLSEEYLEMNLKNQMSLKGLLLNSGKNILVELEKIENSTLGKLIMDFKRNNQLYSRQLALPPYLRTINFDSLLDLINNQEAQLVREYNTHIGAAIDYHKDWRKVQGALGKNEIAIEFSHFRYKTSKEWTDSIFYVAYLIKKEWEEPKMVFLFEEKQLSAILKQKSPNQLYTTRGGKSQTTYKGGSFSDSLYHYLWSPLESYLEGVQKVYYSPDGLLHQIPFAAIGDSTGLLSDKYELVKLSSSYVLAEGQTEPDKSDFILIGGINYEYDTTAQKSLGRLAYNFIDTSLRGTRSNGASWNYLEGTNQEILQLEQLVKENNSRVTSWSSDMATEKRFKALSGKSPRVLHIATHGFFFEDPEDKAQRAEESVYIQSKDPLMRSGLLLSGANYAWSHGSNPFEDENGILTAMEISNMDLSNTDMVVLSACETGLGDINGSEGVYGLQRAFKMAGVNIIVMSLWQVPDKETTQFMNLFYGQWLKGIPVRTAFRKAQNEMQMKYPDEPLKWAAFVLFE